MAINESTDFLDSDNISFSLAEDDGVFPSDADQSGDFPDFVAQVTNE